jgi:alpha-mannosidase
MIREIYLVHHSHTDIGYTHPQPVVMELHRRFIDQALDHIEHTRDWPEDSRFRWTCEVTGITLDWWHHASESDQARLLKAVHDGQLEVAGLAWNMTPLMDHAMLLGVLKPIAFFRELGIPVRSGMNSDVNGWPWGTVDALLDHGITGFSMAINPHFGYAPMPRPRGFWWEGASGRKLLVHNGLQYGVGAEMILRVPVSLEEARTAIPAYALKLEKRGHEQGFIMMQVTNPILFDNAGPRLVLSEFVREWNQAGNPIRLRIATLSEVFDRLRQEPEGHLPTLRGDWTDWWNFGAGSTALETALSLEGQRALREAEQLRVWPGGDSPRQAKLFTDAARALALYAEHTWGADRSIFKPLSSETRIQQGLKLMTAHEGLSLARMLRRDGLEGLAQFAGGEAVTALFYNPLPFPVTRTLRVPRMDADLEPYGTRESQAVHRQDVILGDMTDPLPPDTWHNTIETQWVGPLELPALGYATWPYAALPSPQGQLHADSDGIANTRLRVQFDFDRGGIRSLVLDGAEYARATEWNLAQAVLEYPERKDRRALFSRPNWREPETLQDNWNPDWRAVREGPAKVIRSQATLHAGCAEFVQVLEMSTGDRITNHFRVFPDEPSLELETLINKVGLSDPHALYLTLPLQMEPSASCHFETAGAIIELDREQLPNTSRHYLTTQRFIRLQDGQKGLTVACPDTPLWQVGGFTFGRHDRGQVERTEAMLLAWLCNNYWDTNFQADQAGQFRQRFWLIPHPAEGLEVSIQRALPYAVSPQLHWYKDRGPSQHPSAQLLELDLDGVMLTGLERDGSDVTLRLLNPTDATRTIEIGDGWLKLRAAQRADLAGTAGNAILINRGKLRLELAARSWTGVLLEVSSS